MDLRLSWIREAELACGRLSMLKVLQRQKRPDRMELKAEPDQTESPQTAQRLSGGVKRELKYSRNEMESNSSRKRPRKDRLHIDQLISEGISTDELSDSVSVEQTNKIKVT